MIRNTLTCITITIARQLFYTNSRGLHETFSAQYRNFFCRRFHSLNPLFHQVTSIMQISAEADSRGDHLTRTSTNSRDAGIHSMCVKAINVLSPTIKEVILISEKLPSTLTFKAGQWVDVFIPGVDTVGGFSMCSSPQEMTSSSQLRLAIKYSTHPPALWMHEKCQVGVKLKVRVGGDFYLNWEKGPTFKKILLIAGGVGINPLCSMIHYVMNAKDADRAGVRMILLYSAKTKNELIFKEAFDNYKDNNFDAKYFITNKCPSSRGVLEEQEEDLMSRRLSASDLQFAVNWLAASADTSISNAKNADVEAFICGPPSMITECKDELLAMNITAIHFEKWW